MSGIRWTLLLLLMIMSASIPAQADPSSTSPPPYPPHAPFKPSVLVVVAILTTVFSITFLLLLYAKHCKRATNGYGGSPAAPPSSNIRKNSGVRRTVVESLPVFRFGSLRGPKDGLECAVCLSRFEPSEVLRLLPKCKHAFHVECVDTWLDAHSTCPLCRYRVDPEDILLVQEHSNPLQHHQSLPPPHPPPNSELEDHHRMQTQRVSGRHSSAGEMRRNTNNNKLLQVILQSPSSKRSLDSRTKPLASSSSLSFPHNQIRSSSVGGSGIGYKRRKDGLLLEYNASFDKRFEHRIMISNDEQQQQQRWSDLQPSDLIYLRSEMIMNDSRRRYTSAHGSPNQVVEAEEADDMGSGRIVINPRSASEIVGVSGMRRGDGNENRRQRRNRHVAGVLSRWLAWASIPHQRQPVDHSQSLPL